MTSYQLYFCSSTRGLSLQPNCSSQLFHSSICFLKTTTTPSRRGLGGLMSQVVVLPNNSYKPITNTKWVRARLCKLPKGCTRLAAASDKVYKLLAHCRWFSPGTPASSTTKSGRHDIAEILLNVELNTMNKINTQYECDVGSVCHLGPFALFDRTQTTMKRKFKQRESKLPSTSTK